MAETGGVAHQGSTTQQQTMNSSPVSPRMPVGGATAQDRNKTGIGDSEDPVRDRDHTPSSAGVGGALGGMVAGEGVSMGAGALFAPFSRLYSSGSPAGSRVAGRGRAVVGGAQPQSTPQQTAVTNVGLPSAALGSSVASSRNAPGLGRGQAPTSSPKQLSRLVRRSGPQPVGPQPVGMVSMYGDAAVLPVQRVSTDEEAQTRWRAKHPAEALSVPLAVLVLIVNIVAGASVFSRDNHSLELEVPVCLLILFATLFAPIYTHMYQQRPWYGDWSSTTHLADLVVVAGDLSARLGCGNALLLRFYPSRMRGEIGERITMAATYCKLWNWIVGHRQLGHDLSREFVQKSIGWLSASGCMLVDTDGRVSPNRDLTWLVVTLNRCLRENKLKETDEEEVKRGLAGIAPLGELVLPPVLAAKTGPKVAKGGIREVWMKEAGVYWRISDQSIRMAWSGDNKGIGYVGGVLVRVSQSDASVGWRVAERDGKALLRGDLTLPGVNLVASIVGYANTMFGVAFLIGRELSRGYWVVFANTLGEVVSILIVAGPSLGLGDIRAWWVMADPTNGLRALTRSSRGNCMGILVVEALSSLTGAVIAALGSGSDYVWAAAGAISGVITIIVGFTPGAIAKASIACLSVFVVGVAGEVALLAITQGSDWLTWCVVACSTAEVILLGILLLDLVRASRTKRRVLGKENNRAERATNAIGERPTLKGGQFDSLGIGVGTPEPVLSVGSMRGSSKWPPSTIIRAGGFRHGIRSFHCDNVPQDIADISDGWMVLRETRARPAEQSGSTNPHAFGFEFWGFLVKLANGGAHPILSTHAFPDAILSPRGREQNMGV
ncbi:unnamed protein product [Ectocarpus sp. 12 AP-2014]